MGLYAKGLAFADGYKGNFDRMIASNPEVLQGTSGAHLNWEVVDPEKWVPDGYVCVRVDSRGAGVSPGFLDPFSPREARDYYDCIEWVARQEWSNGKIGLLGISYYAINQWHVAALQPPHLTAICVWEGASDYYRELCRHGGILCKQQDTWFKAQVLRVQHGFGERGLKSRLTGEYVAGPETFSDEELAANRVDPGEDIRTRPLVDDYYRARTAELSRITVPLLSAGNWGGEGGHLRGNIEGYLAVSSSQKWLQLHGSTHFSPFYSDEGVRLQKQFFGHFLKEEDNGWSQRPPVELNIRHPGERFVARYEREWPLARTRWTKYYLDPQHLALTPDPVTGRDLDYDVAGDGVTFRTPPLSEPTEITGPVALQLTLSSETEDADVFAVLRVFDPDGQEVLFIGADDPAVPVGLGWVRASQRKLDPARSTPYRPFHPHDEAWPLQPGVPVELAIEIWPTCIVVPAGHQIALTIRGRDYEHEPVTLPDALYPMTGIGRFFHNDPTDRPPEVFRGRNTIHFAAGQSPYLLLPIIPNA
jgi:predicted acyl esterase